MERDINIRPIRHLLYSFEDEYGSAELKKLIEGIGLTLEYFDDESNWISQEYYLKLLHSLREYTGDPGVAFRYGLNTIKYLKGWGIVVSIISTMATPSVLFKRVIANIYRWGKTGNLSLVDLAGDRAEVELRIPPGFSFDKDICLHIQGQLASIPTLWGLPHAKVNEVQCIADGHECCIYRFTWSEFVFNRMSYRALFAGIIFFIIIYLMNVSGYVSVSSVLILPLILAPAALFCMGRLLAYKRGQFDAINYMEEQDAALLDSLLTRQALSDDLKEMIDERVRSLKKVNDEFHRTIEDLQVTKEQVVQSEKTAAIGSLAAGMAHELNNPMGAIRNFIQDVLEETDEDDPFKSRLEMAELATGRCKRIVDELLSYSWEDRDMSPVDVNINTVIKDSVKEAEEAIAGRKIKITVNAGSAVPEIKIDAMLVRQVFMNIIMNAADAIGESGEIIIKTSCNKGRVNIEISDTGEGINEDIIGRIFDPFFSTKDFDANRGMGLAISSNIIRRMNGDIRVKSRKGEGTTFYITLPV